MFRHSVLVFALLFVSQLAVAAIYKWVDDEGNTHFTDSPPKNKQTKKITVKTNTYKSVQIIRPKQQQRATANRTEPSNAKAVVMYSAEWCGVCSKAKRYFRQKGINFTELDIDKNTAARQQYNSLNATGVPVIFVNGIRMNGFSIKNFEKIYFR